ncbi:hypothetical protein GCM10011609_35100 [Lentzea pudingi]|uniref:Uncharacterized protein n=1 Tax=Lentzea pudingi TaxID=1789439 RepID=A0ABQ2HZQ4_9PSEU|nr:hypothetical protein [Lentzea pudingi]GGM94603.1 hypothetical protein GCM10011609_35100 [Lentzea pudingi]
MTAFLETLGKRVAERWLELILLPGVFWVAVAILAWKRVFNTRALTDLIATKPSPTVVAALLIAASAAGLVATGLGTTTRRLALLRGHWWPARVLTTLRRWRWRRADRKVTAAVAAAVRAAPPNTATVITGPQVADRLARRDAVALEPPERPTWTADQWRALSVRVHRAYGLELTLTWPRLWSVLPEHLRITIATAQNSYVVASTLSGWALLYGVLGVRWWPALPIALAVLVVSLVRTRAATATLCALVESAADLHGRDLAIQLGLEPSGPLSISDGEEISGRLRKDEL